MKIDFVLPMVFPNDPVWFRKWKTNCTRTGRLYYNNNRVRSWNLEKYLFRGLAKFMPWINKVYVIVDGESQHPAWLTGVEFVHHTDIIPMHLLPTFNSNTIEMHIGNIKGLSEHFIYGNDDMICCSPMTEDDFFAYDGLPKIMCREKVIKRMPFNEFQQSVRNSMELAARGTDAKFDHDVLLRDGHSYAPMLLSVVHEMQDLYGDIMHGSCTMFRRRHNISQYLYTYRQWLTFNCVDETHEHNYFEQNSDVKKMQAILRRGGGVCCFNDGNGCYQNFSKAVRKELELLMPEKCKYEL